jgi:CelD/BcsL family acetyltransferase involved in cellulose biosynthesis
MESVSLLNHLRPVEVLQQHIQPVQITLVENLDTLRPRRSEWNALVERSSTNTVFQTLEWHRSWWNAFGSGAQSLVLLAEAAGELVGIAPLMLSVQRILGRKRRVVEFIGTHAADYCDFIVEPAQRPVVSLMLGWLIDHAGRWDLLHLLNIAETSPLLEALPRMFSERGYATDLQRLYECPTRIFGDPASDQRLLKKKDIRDHFNRLRKQGRLEFKVYNAAAEIEGYLDAFFQQHIDRWKDTGTPSFFRDDRQRSFYRELLRLLAPKGWVLFSVVSFNQIPISFHFGYEYGNRIYFIKPTFDPEYRQYAPGMLQLKYLLEYGMERGVRELDFTTGQEQYKYRFSNHARLNYAARVHPYAMFYGLDRLLLYAKAAAKRSPGVRRLGRRLRPWLGDALHRLGL